MEFTNLDLSTFLIFIIIILILLVFWYKTYLSQIIFNNKFKLLSTGKYFYIKYILLILSFFIVLFSIFWPKYWDKKIQNQNNWIDMMFVLDVSKSMNVADIKDSNYAYTRLDVIKDAISKYVTSNIENRYWLVIFAWDAISTIPLTIDKDIFLTFLQNVDYRNLTVQWSDFEKAFELWVERFTSSEDRSKALVFISDWWDNDDIVNKWNIKKIISKNKWITYYVVWVWTKEWWRIITGKDVFGRFNYQTYKWEYVVSKINKNNLYDISSAVDSETYFVNDIWDLSKLNTSISKLEKEVLETDSNWEKANAWRFLSLISFILFILFLFLYIFESKFYFLKNTNE